MRSQFGSYRLRVRRSQIASNCRCEPVATKGGEFGTGERDYLCIYFRRQLCKILLLSFVGQHREV